MHTILKGCIKVSCLFEQTQPVLSNLILVLRREFWLGGTRAPGRRLDSNRFGIDSESIRLGFDSDSIRIRFGYDSAPIRLPAIRLETIGAPMHVCVVWGVGWEGDPRPKGS